MKNYERPADDAFDSTEPVVTLILDPVAERASVGPRPVNDTRALQDLVGGWFRPLSIPVDSEADTRLDTEGDDAQVYDVILWVDDDGIAKRLPPNGVATALAHALGAHWQPDDFLCGTAVVTGSGPAPGDPEGERGMVNLGVPGEVIDRACRIAVTSGWTVEREDD